MSTTAFTQMNVRIDAALKVAGDDALSSIGLTPTQAVRTLWELAAQRGEQLEKVHQFLRSTEEDGNQNNAKSTTLEAGRRIVPDALASLGVSEGAAASVALDDDALKEAAMLERAQRKGWL